MKQEQQSNNCSTCQNVKNQDHTDPNLKLVHDIYKNVKMGSDSINTLLPKVENPALRQDMTTQLLGYENFSVEATKLLLEQGESPKDISLLQKLPAEAGIHMNTLIDNSTSKIAELMINGSVMGVIDATRALNNCKNSCPAAATKLAQDVITFEDNNITRLRTYL